jgi:hypothetical protein
VAASSRAVTAVAAATSTAVVVAVVASAARGDVAVPVVPSVAVEVPRPHKFSHPRDEGRMKKKKTRDAMSE